MIISLIGYMGSGKSTTGIELAKTLGYEFIDLDLYIESKFEMTVSEIFEKFGELGFRKREREALHDVLHKTNLVLSLGGGTPVYYDNMEVINKNSLSFYLRLPVYFLAKRLENKKEKRPLIAHLSNEDLTEYIAKHLFERNHYYNQAQHIISVTTQSPSEVLAEIVQHIKK